MTNEDLNISKPYQSRVDRIEKLIKSISEFEQDELRQKLNFLEIENYNRLFENKQNVFNFMLHNFIFYSTAYSIVFLTIFLCTSPFNFIKGLNLLNFLQSWLILSIIFGALTSLSIIILKMVLLPKLAKSLFQKHSLIGQFNQFELPLNATDALNICHSVLYAKPDIKVESIDNENNTINATTGFSLRSPGEMIGLKIDPIAINSCKISIYSKSLFATIDLGKNQSNIFLLTKLILQAANDKALLSEHE